MVSGLFIHLFPPQQYEGGFGSAPWDSGRSWEGSEECLCRITDILTFWEIAGLIPSKMSLEFASSSDRETEKPFLEVRHAVWFLRHSKDFAEKYNVVIRFGD